MAFHSLHFLVFFCVVLVASWSLRRAAVARQVLLLAASYYFYMSWSVLYGLLMLAMTTLDFFVARRIAAVETRETKRRWLILSLTSNLGMLFVFKYYNFFVDTFRLHGPDGSGVPYSTLALPLGISFFTFEALSYTIDVYRGVLTPTRSLLKFCLFISFFPRMVAGPIIRAAHFLPQLERPPRFDDDRAVEGLGRILLGLFKKLCIADVLGTTLVDPTFADPTSAGGGVALLAMYAYAFQIYYDFSGYSDIALGAARMLGFDLPENFQRPYVATSIRDFWRRWHISLSTWLRDYLYVPLGGGRGTVLATARNLAIVMLLGGLWHGASWMFVLWGGLQGFLLAAGRVFHASTGIEADRPSQPLVTRFARIAVTFHLVAASFVVFRAPNLPTLNHFLDVVWTWRATTVAVPGGAWAALLLAAVLEWAPTSMHSRVHKTFVHMPSPLRGGLVAAGVLFFGVLGGGSPFIYFQF